jgi:foldase protein PrsA
MRNLIFLCVGFFFLFAWPACSPEAGPSQAVVIRVGDRSITVGDLERTVETTSLENGIPKEQIWSSIGRLVDTIVDDALVLEYGRDKGITLSEIELERAIQDIVKDYPEGSFEEMLLNRCIDYGEWKSRFREQLLLKKVVEEHSRSLAPVSYHAIKSYYEERKEDFWHPVRAQFMQIVSRTKDEAEAVLSRLQGGEDMARLWKEQSSYSRLQGDRCSCWVTRDVLPPPLADIIFSIPLGEVSNIIKTAYGYHIVKVLKREPKGRKQVLEVMGEIENRLLSERIERHYAEWIAQLRNEYAVEVDYTVLDKMRSANEGT